MKTISFLRGTPAPPTRVAHRLTTVMKNWLNIHAEIKTLPADQTALNILRWMMIYELTHDRRLHIIYRLRTRFNKLRSQIEEAELYEGFK